MEFAFEKGSDLLIRVNGEILGGVKKLKRAVKTDTEGIYQFLTDKPVARWQKKTYELELWLRCAGDCVLADTVHSVCVSDGDKTELYTLCAVKCLESTAQARGAVEYHAVIDAAERSVLFE